MTSNTGPILVFPRIQPFGSDDCSSLGKVYSRHATGSVNCENSSVSFVMKYCPTPTVVRNPASVQNLITRFCCASLSTRSWYFCNRSSCAGSSVEGVGVLFNELVGCHNSVKDCASVSSKKIKCCVQELAGTTLDMSAQGGVYTAGMIRRARLLMLPPLCGCMS